MSVILNFWWNHFYNKCTFNIKNPTKLCQKLTPRHKYRHISVVFLHFADQDTPVHFLLTKSYNCRQNGQIFQWKIPSAMFLFPGGNARDESIPINQCKSLWHMVLQMMGVLKKVLQNLSIFQLIPNFLKLLNKSPLKRRD